MIVTVSAFRRGRASGRRRRRLALLIALPVALVASQMILPSLASAYNGEFCYGYYMTKTDFGCQGNLEPHVRRAIAHGPSWIVVGLYAKDGKAYDTDYCYSNGCTADTGYYSQDVTAFAEYQELPGHLAQGYGYGWMYP